MTVDDIIDQIVTDAVMEVAFEKNSETHRAVLKESLYSLKLTARRRFHNQLVFNKMRELLGRRKPK